MNDPADPFLAVRTSPAYPRAIWLARAANLVCLPVLVWKFTSEAGIDPAQPGWVFLTGWAIGALLLGSTWILLFRAGLPIGPSQHRRATVTTRWQILFDVFRPRRYWGV